MQRVADAADVGAVAQRQQRVQGLHGVLDGVNRTHAVEAVPLQVLLVRRLQFQPEADGLQHLDRRFKRVLAEQGTVAHANLLVAHHLGAHLEAPQFGQKARHRARAQGVQDFRFLLRFGARVVRHLDRLGVDVPLGRVAPGDEILAAAVQVDGAVVALAVHLPAAHRADRRPGAAVVKGPRRADAAQVDPAMRLLAGGVPRFAVGALQEHAVTH